MTDRKKKSRKLSHEILGLLAASMGLALMLLQFLRLCATGVAESFLFARDIALTQAQWAQLNGWILHVSLLFCVGFFVVLFLALLGDRLAYIRTITQGIDALGSGALERPLPAEGNNELTRLAEAVNYLSATQQQVKQKEQALQQEREQLIRSLSHDIRTPLTSILSYAEYLSAGDASSEKSREYLDLIRRKAEQIRELTDVLLSGGVRNPEYFEDARLLMAQLAEEFSEALEDRFVLAIGLEKCPAFSGTFDVGEMRRIFDNLASNIQKYADPTVPVVLEISLEEQDLVIRQRNAVKATQKPEDSYGMGLKSIRRIAQGYRGTVAVETDSSFSILVRLAVQ